MTLSNSGCTLTGGFIGVMWESMLFWKTLPAVPVPARASQLMEDKLHEDERYNKVPVLDPVEGDVFCVDPPSEDQVIRALPDDGAGGFWAQAKAWGKMDGASRWRGFRVCQAQGAVLSARMRISGGIARGIPLVAPKGDAVQQAASRRLRVARSRARSGRLSARCAA
jgi:hypothetical protein